MIEHGWLFRPSQAERRGYLALAFVAQAEGKAKEVRHYIQLSGDLARHSPRHEAVLQLMPDKVRLWLLQGNLAAATWWARDKTGHTDLTDTEQIALARVWYTQGEAQQLEKALKTLAPLRPRVQAQGRNRRLLEILLLEALIQHVHKLPELALAG